MTDRLNIVSPRNYTTRDGEVKTAFTKIGVAYATKSGWALTFEALPLPSINDKGVIETKVLLMPPREDDAGDKPRRSVSRSDEPRDDDIPF
jgi:hypothetical protein